MSVLIVIPARMASTRYPGKPLVPLKGPDGISKTLIHRTWEAAMAAKGVDRVVVATDDAKISDVAQNFGAEVVMTSKNCANGTERCAEAVVSLKEEFEIIVNVQGDAPLTPPWFIENLIDGLKANPLAEVATPVLRCDGKALNGFLADRKNGRVGGTTVVFGQNKHALYFSKEVIPHVNGPVAPDATTSVFHHVGIYAYRPSSLMAYPHWSAGVCEMLEGLEQLRFLEHDRPILCVEVDAQGQEFWELNNPEDVARIEAMLLKN